MISLPLYFLLSISTYTYVVYHARLLRARRIGAHNAPHEEIDVHAALRHVSRKAGVDAEGRRPDPARAGEAAQARTFFCRPDRAGRAATGRGRVLLDLPRLRCPGRPNIGRIDERHHGTRPFETKVRRYRPQKFKPSNLRIRLDIMPAMIHYSPIPPQLLRRWARSRLRAASAS